MKSSHQLPRFLEQATNVCLWLTANSVFVGSQILFKRVWKLPKKENIVFLLLCVLRPFTMFFLNLHFLFFLCAVSSTSLVYFSKTDFQVKPIRSFIVNIWGVGQFRKNFLGVSRTVLVCTWGTQRSNFFSWNFFTYARLCLNICGSHKQITSKLKFWWCKAQSLLNKWWKNQQFCAVSKVSWTF